MSLCGTAAASGSTARPPGQQKGHPPTQESPKGEKQVDSSLITESILGILSVAPATNDRCSEVEEMCYALLQALIIEDVRCTNYKEASPVPLDWSFIHGDEYNKDQESAAPGSTNDNNDNDDNDNYKVNYDDW